MLQPYPPLRRGGFLHWRFVPLAGKEGIQIGFCYPYYTAMTRKAQPHIGKLACPAPCVNQRR
jgi:hypothetical protein